MDILLELPMVNEIYEDVVNKGNLRLVHEYDNINVIIKHLFQLDAYRQPKLFAFSYLMIQNGKLLKRQLKSYIKSLLKV